MQNQNVNSENKPIPRNIPESQATINHRSVCTQTDPGLRTDISPIRYLLDYIVGLPYTTGYHTKTTTVLL